MNKEELNELLDSFDELECILDDPDIGYDLDKNYYHNQFNKVRASIETLVSKYEEANKTVEIVKLLKSIDSN